ncbi:MAG: L-lactate dehydrogenase complex protein LldF [Actinomycetota bacterium]|jgi:L-lactate dehydrogenase complex protein LldF|nr:L-lactate dehydrogenase complex protein LldF [Actinomycetota bacterium]
MSGHGITTPGRDFHERTATAIADPLLQQALHNLDRRLRTAGESAAAHPEWKDRAAAIRRETLVDLDGWLDRLERSLTARDVHVHRAATPDDARRVVLELARARGARTVVKSKSMATEEIDLGHALEQAGLTSVETDLGEYIVQLAGERPSHMIVPAIHKTLPQIRDVLAREARADLAVDREVLTAWARERLRGEFLRADIGITGVNFAAADTGTLVLVTNEGNGRFCTTLPRVHVAVMPVEKVIPRLADVGVLLPLLTTHATGQALSNYVTMISGPRRAGELDGPDELHVVFLDNRRSTLLGTRYEEMLACIRCGACLNVCPVYRNVSGHAYDAVYSGPMGKVLTPLLSGGAEGADLPFGSTLCHACSDACPVKIPLGDMIVALRADTPGGSGAPAPRRRRMFWTMWARAWSTPRGYRLTTALGRMSRGRVPGLRAWTSTRELPRPAREPFRERWAKEHR